MSEPIAEGYELEQVEHIIPGRPRSWYLKNRSTEVSFKFPDNESKPSLCLCLSLVKLLEENRQRGDIINIQDGQIHHLRGVINGTQNKRKNWY